MISAGPDPHHPQVAYLAARWTTPDGWPMQVWRDDIDRRRRITFSDELIFAPERLFNPASSCRE